MGSYRPGRDYRFLLPAGHMNTRAYPGVLLAKSHKYIEFDDSWPSDIHGINLGLSALQTATGCDMANHCR